jgi:uncharacterized cofD-like protein
MQQKQKIVTIGGGTGSFVLLSGLKKYPVDLSAIVSMADDGGSTGILRDELGVLPPGDIRQCLVALSASSSTLRELFKYRYVKGHLQGDNFGNIFLSTLEKITGNFDTALREAEKILRIRGKVIPVTLTNTKLIAILQTDKRIVGQYNIELANLAGLKKLILNPAARLHPEAALAIKEADKVIINPGNLYTSIIPCLLVKGLPEAINRSRAKKIYVCNLMTKFGQTNGYSVVDFLQTLEFYLGKKTIDCVIYNTGRLTDKIVKKYLQNKEYFVQKKNLRVRPDICFIGRKLLSKKLHKPAKGDKISRTLVRHDSEKLAKLIYDL